MKSKITKNLNIEIIQGDQVESLKAGEILYEAKQYSEAFRHFQKALDEAPKDAKVKMMLGLTEIKLLNPAKAVELFCSAIEIDPNNSELYYFLGDAMCQINQYDAAHECFLKSLELNPDDHKTEEAIQIVEICRRAMSKLSATELEIVNSNRVHDLLVLNIEYYNKGNREASIYLSSRLLQINPDDYRSQFLSLASMFDGSHKKSATARDGTLDLIETNNLFKNPTLFNLSVIRFAADRCSNIGPFNKSIELYRLLAPLSQTAEDYFRLSETLAQGNYFEESIKNLLKAMEIDPATYNTQSNRETIELATARQNNTSSQHKPARKEKIGRYPATSDFTGDFGKLIKNFIAINLANEEKFIGNKTNFFTMGSCFARSISSGLNSKGYTSRHLEISEYVNTTYANRAFIDWLIDPDAKSQVNSRFRELIPAEWDPNMTLKIINESDVFILTLGVAPAFFDKSSGAFILPRPSALNSRALAEKYIFRTTSVTENVSNVLYLLKFIRSLSPSIKIVVTVSPIPIIASFEFESCVQADCLSKSIMRVVAHEVTNNSGIENIFYWPSFEIFRWAGSNSSSYYSVDDGAAWHVSESKVAGTVDAFIDLFSY